MIHIMPKGDCRKHEFLTTCECDPAIEVLGTGELMVIHDSFDGREGLELARKILDDQDTGVA